MQRKKKLKIKKKKKKVVQIKQSLEFLMNFTRSPYRLVTKVTSLLLKVVSKGSRLESTKAILWAKLVLLSQLVRASGTLSSRNSCSSGVPFQAPRPAEAQALAVYLWS